MIYTSLRIFSVNGTKLSEVLEQQFPLESETHRLTEANLNVRLSLFDIYGYLRHL
jgi:hypothetical protein